MGLQGRTFAEKYASQVSGMERSFLEFMKSSRQRANVNNGQAAQQDASDSDNHAESVCAAELKEIKMTARGYPIIPKIVMEKTLSKRESEDLLRAYLSQHYCESVQVTDYGSAEQCLLDLANGSKQRPVPFTAINQDMSSFIPAEYRPGNVTFKDPRNMQLEQVLSVLRHCHERQSTLGPESAFRFAQVIGRNRQRVLSSYPEERDRRSSPDKRSRRDKGKQRDVEQLQGLLQMEQNTPDVDRERAHSTLPSGLPGHQSGPAAPVGSSDLATIGMGDMLRLKNIGCNEIFGPINGPNQGLPQYQVPSTWLQRLLAGPSRAAVQDREQQQDPHWLARIQGPAL